MWGEGDVTLVTNFSFLNELEPFLNLAFQNEHIEKWKFVFRFLKRDSIFSRGAASFEHVNSEKE